MVDKGEVISGVGGLCVLVLGLFALKSCGTSLYESLEYQRKMNRDLVPPSGYTAEDGTVLTSSKAWEYDDNVIATLPNGDVIQYINVTGEDSKLESVVITSGDSQKTILPGETGFDGHQKDYEKHVGGIRQKFEHYRALDDARRMQRMMRF